MPAYKPTELSRIKLKFELNSVVNMTASGAAKSDNPSTQRAPLVTCVEDLEENGVIDFNEHIG